MTDDRSVSSLYSSNIWLDSIFRLLLIIVLVFIPNRVSSFVLSDENASKVSKASYAVYTEEIRYQAF